MGDVVLSRVLRVAGASIFATWGVVAVVIPSLGWFGAAYIALIIGMLFFLTSASESVPRALGFALVGAVSAGVFIGLLVAGERTAATGPGQPPGYLLLAVAGFGAVFGSGIGLLVKSPRLPDMQFFRKEFLETCVFAGLLGGFLVAPFVGFKAASAFATDATFGFALLGASLFAPLRVGALVMLKARGRSEAVRDKQESA